MRNGKKNLALMTPVIIFNPLTIKTKQNVDGQTEEEISKIRKILEGYEELNKLYDDCIERINKEKTSS